MAPPQKEKINRLIAYLKDTFGQGIQAGTEVLQYIDSTLSNPSCKELAAVLADETHPERDTLLELIFYPDLSIQLSLEEVLGSYFFSKKDMEAVRSSLCKVPLETIIHFADGRGTIPLTASPPNIDAFLKRLNLTKTIDSRILKSLEKYVSDADRLLTKVKLRNARVNLVGSGVGFLCRYFETMYPDRSYWEGLDFLLVFLEQADTAPDIYPALMSEKKRLLGTLRKIETAEEIRQSENIETLILRGERFPHADRQEILKSIAVIDRTALKIFGKTDWTTSPTPALAQFDGLSQYLQFLRKYE